MMTPRHRSILSPIAAITLTATLFLPWIPLPSSAPPSANASIVSNVNSAKPANENVLPVIDSKPPSVVDASNIKYRLLAGRIAETYSVTPSFAERIVRSAHDVGTKQNVDPLLLLALVGVESSFNPQARNASGAIGLTQTIPKWHPEKIAVIRQQGKSITDPEANLEMGAKILAEYTALSRGDHMRGLQRYNGALGDRKQRYANKVMGVYQNLSRSIPPAKIQLAMEQGVPKASASN